MPTPTQQQTFPHNLGLYLKPEALTGLMILLRQWLVGAVMEAEDVSPHSPHVKEVPALEARPVGAAKSVARVDHQRVVKRTRSCSIGTSTSAEVCMG